MNHPPGTLLWIGPNNQYFQYELVIEEFGVPKTIYLHERRMKAYGVNYQGTLSIKKPLTDIFCI